jgi:hypothetical protein
VHSEQLFNVPDTFLPPEVNEHALPLAVPQAAIFSQLKFTVPCLEEQLQ